MKQNQKNGCNRIREHFFSFLVFFFLSKPGTRSYPQYKLDLRFYEDLKAYLKPNSEDYLQPMITFLSWITTIRDS